MVTISPSTTSPTGVAALIAERVRRHPDRWCVVTDEECLSYEQVWERSGELADRLRGAGLGPGHKIAILSPNSSDCVVAMVAILRLGAVWLPVNYRDSVSIMRDTLGRLGGHALLVAPTFTSNLGELIDGVPSIGAALVLGSGQRVHTGTIIAPGPGDRDLAAVFTTGGTTGAPKGVAFTRERLSALIRAYAQISARDADVYLAAAPLTHVGGRICLGVLASGGTTVVLPGFDEQAVFEAIERHRVTTFTVTPTMLYRLLDHPDARSRDTSSLRALVYGGGPTAPSRIRQALEVFGPVLESGFGQTEAPMFMTRMSPEEHVDEQGLPAPEDRLRSVGRPTQICDLVIVDEAGTQLSPGQIGEIAVRGDFTMAGYYRDPDATQARRAGEHWRTGDLGYLDPAGYLTIQGRVTDMIITGGFNVYPAEVENAVMEIPGVRECAVFGMPDDEWGERVVLAVALHLGADLTAEAIRTALRPRLGGVKTPKDIRIVDDLARNSNGKILKRAIALALSSTR
ncbi:class I adenylate-forming enzyme family protein [Streptomyces sp. NPDC020792]|uniref:class I adenylate-forming enzyme family protein n=1 Tax=Streptomyces sp. NPDC020792 TaxID=3365089 RepID=UPI0037B01DC2